MAEHKIYHIAEILDAAIPYLPTPYKPMAEVFAKGLSFIHCIKKINTKPLTASSFEDEEYGPDELEALLSGIRPVCNEEEKKIIDKVLNIFDSIRIIEMYNSYMSAMEGMDGDENDNKSSGFSSTGMMDMLKEMIPPEQEDTIENLSMLFNSMSYDNSDDEIEDEDDLDGGHILDE